MNLKIAFSVLIAFVITFSALFTLNSVFPLPSEEDHSFYTEKLDHEMKNVFIFGSSQIGRLNTTRVDEMVSQKFPDYSVYNLALSSDKPKQRIKSIDTVITAQPEIVFYSISYRDFNSPLEKEQPQTDLHKLFQDVDLAKRLGIDSLNPRLMFFQIIKNFSDRIWIFQVLEDPKLKETTPFFGGQKFHFIISDEEELLRQVTKYGLDQYNIGPSPTNEQVLHFKRIIDNLQKNDIKIVVFTTPLHRSYLDALPNSEKQKFDLILSDVEKEFEVKIYRFTDKYADLDVWSDVEHVAYNPKSIVFSEDVGRMIITEIEP